MLDRRSSFLAAVALAVVLTVAALSRCDRGPAQPAPEAAGAAAAATEPAAPAAAPVADAPLRNGAGPAAAPPAGLRVQVRDARGPVAGATITVRGGERPVFPPTDANGISVAAAFPAGDVVLDATHAGAEGVGDWRDHAPLVTECTIYLHLPRDVDVRVRGPASEPLAGVPIELAPFDDRYASTSLAGTTDPRGVARVHVPGGDVLAWGPGLRATVQLEGRSFTAPATHWADGAGAVTELTIDVPALPPRPPGLTVRFVEVDGSPAHVRGTLTLSRFEQQPNVRIGGYVADVAVDGTTATLPQVQPGDDVELELDEPGRLRVTHALVVPPGAGASTTTIVRGKGAPRVEVPLVGANGLPRAGEELAWFVRYGDGHTDEGRSRLGTDGLLGLDLRADRAGSLELAHPFAARHLRWPPRQRLERPYNTTDGEPPPDPVLAVVAFPALAPGRVHRGDAVAVPEVAVRVRGRVVAGDGRGVADVRIRVAATAPPTPQELRTFETRSGDDGAFTIEATALPDEVLVFGRRPLGFCAPVRVRTAAAAEPVVLTLQPTGAITMPVLATSVPGAPEHPMFHLVLDDPALPEGWWVLFQDRDTSVDRELWDRWQLEHGVRATGGALELRDLVPATYELRGSLGRNRLPTVRPVRVRGGETLELPPASVGAGLERVFVRVLANGNPLAKAQVRFTLPEWSWHFAATTNDATDENGEAWFVVPRGAVADVEIHAIGRATKRVPAARFPLEVTMHDGATLALALRGHEALGDQVRALVLCCRPHGDAPPDTPVQVIGELRMLHHPQVTLTADGRGAIPNLPPGRYRAWLAALPPIMGQRRDITFVPLGDHTATGDERIELAHELTAAERATLARRRMR
jgi:hypothetical protein